MLALSEEFNIAPCLFARIVLECHVKALFPELGIVLRVWRRWAEDESGDMDVRKHGDG